MCVVRCCLLQGSTVHIIIFSLGSLFPMSSSRPELDATVSTDTAGGLASSNHHLNRFDEILRLASLTSFILQIHCFCGFQTDPTKSRKRKPNPEFCRVLNRLGWVRLEPRKNRTFCIFIVRLSEFVVDENGAFHVLDGAVLKARAVVEAWVRAPRRAQKGADPKRLE